MKMKMTDNFSTDAILVMIVWSSICKKLMTKLAVVTKHSIKPSLSKSQHAGVTKNGLDNIRRTNARERRVEDRD